MTSISKMLATMFIPALLALTVGAIHPMPIQDPPPPGSDEAGCEYQKCYARIWQDGTVYRMNCTDVNCASDGPGAACTPAAQATPPEQWCDCNGESTNNEWCHMRQRNDGTAYCRDDLDCGQTELECTKIFLPATGGEPPLPNRFCCKCIEGT